MSDLYRADASNFTREQLVELINLQTQLHIEAKGILVVAKKEIEELKAMIVGARPWVGVANKYYYINRGDLNKWLEKAEKIK